MKKSAGVLVYYLADGEWLVLVVHSAGPLGLEPWSIPKGEFDPAQETPEHAAAREVGEELGVAVPVAGLVPLGESTYRNKRKRVYAFAWHAGGAPPLHPDPHEIAAAEFCRLDEARVRLHPDQVVFVDRLAELLSPREGPQAR